MINGFVLEIWNRSSETEELLLFKDESKHSELEVTVLHASYSFESLILMAKTQGFIGSGVQCDPDFIQEMVVHTEQGT